MNALNRLRQLVDVADPNGTVTVTVRWLSDLLAQDAALPSETSLAPGGDLTVDDVCAQVGRAPSTVRGWLQRGELRGYRLNGRDWRVPPAALREYLEAQQAPAPARDEAGHVDIRAWRREVPTEKRSSTTESESAP